MISWRTAESILVGDPPARVLICGDRRWADKRPILGMLRMIPPGSTIIEGEARGADSLAREAALDLQAERQLCVIAVPADWDQYKRAAGPIRNGWMLLQRPDRVWAFHENLRESKGTLDMVRRALRAGVVCTNIYGRSLGPGLGGLRFAAAASLAGYGVRHWNTLEALEQWLTA